MSVPKHRLETEVGNYGNHVYLPLLDDCGRDHHSLIVVRAAPGVLGYGAAIRIAELIRDELGERIADLIEDGPQIGELPE